MCVPADGFPGHRETWLCGRPENHKTAARRPLPPAPPARRGFAAADASGQTWPGGLRERKADSPRRPPPVARKQRRARRGGSRTPLAFGAQSAALQSIRGGRAQGRTPHPGKVTRATWRRRWALSSGGGGRLQRAGGGPSAGRARGPCGRRGPCLRGVFSSPARSWRRLGCLETVNYAAFVCRVGEWGQGRPKSTAPARIRCSPLAEREVFPRASPGAEAEMISRWRITDLKTKQGTNKQTNK